MKILTMSSSCNPGIHKLIAVKIEENDIYSGIYKVLEVLRPHWPTENINFKVFTDGITNKLVACQANNEEIVLVRIYGNKTDLLIDRNAEVRNITNLHKIGLAPEIYGVFMNGLAYEFYPGVTLTPTTVIDSKICKLVAKQMAKMHKVQIEEEVSREAAVWDKIEQFLALIPEKFTDPNKQQKFANSFGSITRLRIEFERLKSQLTKIESPIVFAHNDLLLGNVIYNETNCTVKFIDYEYAAYNYQAFDIANHFNEFVGISIDDIDYEKYPKKEFQDSWIRTYLSEFLEVPEVPSEEIEKVYRQVQCFGLASHFMWGIWSLVQYELSDIDFDFGRDASGIFYDCVIGRYNNNYETVVQVDMVAKERHTIIFDTCYRYAEIRLNRYNELKEGVYKEYFCPCFNT